MATARSDSRPRGLCFRLFTCQRTSLAQIATASPPRSACETPATAYRRCTRKAQPQTRRFDRVPRGWVANNIAKSLVVNGCRENSFQYLRSPLTPAKHAGADVSTGRRSVHETECQTITQTAWGDQLTFKRGSRLSRIWRPFSP